MHETISNDGSRSIAYRKIMVGSSSNDIGRSDLGNIN